MKIKQGNEGLDNMEGQSTYGPCVPKTWVQSPAPQGSPSPAGSEPQNQLKVVPEH